MKKSRDYLRRLVEPGPTGGTPVPVLMPAPTLKELLDDVDSLREDTQGLWEEAADRAAYEILHHIDTMYPEMWHGVPTTARISLRNVIRQQLSPVDLVKE